MFKIESHKRTNHKEALIGGRSGSGTRSVLSAACGCLLASCTLPWDDSPIARLDSDTPSVAGGGSQSNTAKLDRPPVIEGKVALPSVIECALSNNLNVNVLRQKKQVSDADLDAAKGAFAPKLTGGINRYPEGWSNMDSHISLEKTISWTGTTVSVQGGRLVNPALGAAADPTTLDQFNGAVVKVSQLLLRGADWLSNRADIEIGKLQVKDANAGTQAAILETLRNAETAYWTAAFAHEIYKSQLASLGRTRQIKELVEARKREGQATNLDILEADAAEALARDGEARELKQYREAVGTMWNAAGCKVNEPDPALRFADLGGAPVANGAPSPESSVARAMQFNPQTLVLANSVYRKQLELRRAKNNALPEVNLTFGYGTNPTYAVYNGVNNAAVAAPYNPLGENKLGSWNAGLTFSMPFPWGEERAKMKAAAAELEASKLAREDGLRQLRKDIFETCWEIEASRQQVVAGEAGLAANSQKYEQMVARLKEGLATVRQVMEAENELRRASEVLLDARLRQAVAIVLLSRQDGSITSRHRLAI